MAGDSISLLLGQALCYTVAETEESMSPEPQGAEEHRSPEPQGADGG